MSTSTSRLWMASAVLLAGCAMPGWIGQDAARVRDLTRAPFLARSTGTLVDPAASSEVRRLLGQPMNAEQAVKIALLNNRALRATLQELGIARGQLVQAGLLPNPAVEVELLPERNTAVELRLEYDLSGLILRPLRARVASADLRVARVRAAGAVLRLGYEVRTRFLALQAATERLAIAQRGLDAIAAGKDAALAMRRAGNVAALDVSTQVVAYERARVQVAGLELRVAEAREALQRLLGLHGKDTAWRIQGKLRPVPAAVPSREALEKRALRASLDLMAIRHAAEAAAGRVNLARTQGWLPGIHFDVHSLYGSPEETGGPVAPWRFGGGLSLKIPLFDRKQGEIQAHEARVRGLRERYLGKAVDVRSAVRTAHNRVRSAHARARYYERIIVPAQARVLRQTLRQYNAMQLGIFQLLQVRREQLDVELEYVETLRQYWTAVAALDALLAGKEVEGGTQEASSPLRMGTDSKGGH